MQFAFAMRKPKKTTPKAFSIWGGGLVEGSKKIDQQVLGHGHIIYVILLVIDRDYWLEIRSVIGES